MAKDNTLYISAQKEIDRADLFFHEKNFNDAAAIYKSIAESTEIPDGGLCCRLAKCLIETGQFTEACDWSLRVVDSSYSFANWTTAANLIEKCGPESHPRLRRKIRVGVVGTWTTNQLIPLLKISLARQGLWSYIFQTPFNQYFNETLNPDSDLFAWGPDVIILCPDYRSLGIPPFSKEPELAIASELSRWTNVWNSLRNGLSLTIIQHNFALPDTEVFGHLGSTLNGSRQYISQEINRLMGIHAQNEDVSVVDVNLLAGRFGKNNWFDHRNWYFAKIAMASSALPLVAQHTSAVLAAKLGLSRRCLVLDLDNTLWGGVIGDDGISGISIGNGPDGEAFADFQHAIKDLSRRGIMLAVCSKNDFDTAQIPFLNHPDMVLKLEDITIFVANWQAKSDNIVSISKQLDQGLDAITFIDDNPYERVQVRRSLPQVDVITLPAHPSGYRKALESYPHFEPSSFTPEDLQRTQQYQARAKAKVLKENATSLDEYQASLNMMATVGPIDDANITRVVQLINKTNQFNLTTRRRNVFEVQSLLKNKNIVHFWIRLKDQFADHGLIAVIIGRHINNTLDIDTLVMSCRVIGRGVENIIFNELVTIGQKRKCQALSGIFIPTDRNKLVKDLYEQLGFEQLTNDKNGRTTWNYMLLKSKLKKVHIQTEYYISPGEQNDHV